MLSFLTAACFVLFFTSCTLKQTPISKTGFYFDTIINITIYDSNSETDTILSDCMLLCQKYENLFSKTKKDSDIYRINHSLGKETIVDEETIALLKEAVAFSEKCNGVIDPTVGALTNLWAIGTDSFTIPREDDIIFALSTIDYGNIEINPQNNSVKLLNQNTQLDLGCIAKGYIADRLKKMLIENGVNSAIINLGGNVLCIGTKDNSKFKVGIKNPKNTSSSPVTVVMLDGNGPDAGVVSSGNYERTNTINGIVFHHIFSLKTGLPVGIIKTENGYCDDSNLAEVSVISASSVLGDELSTLCFILGYDESCKFLKDNYPNIKAIFINKEGKIIGDFPSGSFSVQ